VADGEPRQPGPLDRRFPRVSYILGAYLFGDDDLEFEIDEIVATEGAQQAGLILTELRKLLADPTVGDEELTSYVGAASAWLIHTGRETLQFVADRLEKTLG
jgi:hypothetical protein